MSAKKRPVKTPEKAAGKRAASGKPFAKGKDARRNVTKPGSGRPPDEFKQRMRDLASSQAVYEHLDTVIQDPNHLQWLGALKYATEHGYGKAREHLELSGKLTLESIITESMKP